MTYNKRLFGNLFLNKQYIQNWSDLLRLILREKGKVLVGWFSHSFWFDQMQTTRSLEENARTKQKNIVLNVAT